jgi:hypothetical protein
MTCFIDRYHPNKLKVPEPRTGTGIGSVLFRTVIGYLFFETPVPLQHWLTTYSCVFYTSELGNTSTDLAEVWRHVEGNLRGNGIDEAAFSCTPEKLGLQLY